MVTLDQYLVVLKQKAMDKKVVKIRELKGKEKEDRRSRRVECRHTEFSEQFKGELKRRIKLSSMMHGALLLVKLLVKKSTTIS
jgi:hypothetical protein